MRINFNRSEDGGSSERGRILNQDQNPRLCRKKRWKDGAHLLEFSIAPFFYYGVTFTVFVERP
jgi:hypothetical protein